MLLAEKCSVKAFDPAAMERAEEMLPASSNLQYVSDSYAAASSSDAVVILTDWTEFAHLDLRRLASAMRYPILIDGRNLYDAETMRMHGITYVSMGRPSLHPLAEQDGELRYG
jgi:UDPglucose 6-dehydrogenase